jgi:hypothetical protein
MEQGIFSLIIFFHINIYKPIFSLYFFFSSFFIHIYTCFFLDGSIGKVIRLTHVLAASFAGLIAAAAASHYRKQLSTVVLDKKIIPKVDRSESGRIGQIEKFSHYVGMFLPL